MARKPQATRLISRSKRNQLLLAILALALASLACINGELTLTVLQPDQGAASLDVNYQQYLVPSYVEAAKAANSERAADFQAAGRDPGEPLLPTTKAELAEAFDIKKYQDLGFSIQESETGFTASRNYSLEQDRVTEDWKVRVIRDPNHPEQITYRVKVFIDLTDTDLEDLQKLRSEPLMAKPDPNDTSGSYSGGSGFIGDLVGTMASMADAAEGQMAVEMYYAQKALINSQPMEYKFVVTLPGEILIHNLEGNPAGTLEGNTVTLILSEADLNAYSGRKLTFHVESVLKDCSLACNEPSQPHLIWDGNEDGESCKCVCEAGYEVITGERACVNCDTVCSWADPNSETNLASCENNQCACQCKDGYELNNDRTKCITTAEAEAEDSESAPGKPSTNDIGGVVTAIILGMDAGDIRLLDGWLFLSPGEREDLLDLVEALGIAVDRTGLLAAADQEMTDEERNQRIQEDINRQQRLEEIAIGIVEDEIDDRRRIQEVIIAEIGGSTRFVEYAGDAWGTITNIKDFLQSPYEMAEQYFNDKFQGEIKDQILNQIRDGSPATIEEAAAQLIKDLPYLATKNTIDDYYLYKEFYSKHCPDPVDSCTEEEAKEAHQDALAELEIYLNDIQEDVESSYYGISRINWAKPGEAYDRAFETLRRLGK